MIYDFKSKAVEATLIQALLDSKEQRENELQQRLLDYKDEKCIVERLTNGTQENLEKAFKSLRCPNCNAPITSIHKNSYTWTSECEYCGSLLIAGGISR